ncbi:MAG: hypothetical protein MR802_03850 [Prevotella sp.]|nr:hypothetical protein [Prevotella sp.]
MNPLSLKKTWVLVSTDLSAPQCFFNQYVEIDMPYNDFIAFSEQQRKFVVEAEMSKLGYVLENRNNIVLDVTDFVSSNTNLSESVKIVNEIVNWCDHSFKSLTDRHYNEYGTRYIGEQLVEAVNRWKAHDIQEACKNCLRDLTKDQVKHIQEISMKLDAMLNENNNCTPKELLESTKELIDKVLERINEKLSIISM